MQLLVEDVTGRHLSGLARELIFVPVGMTHSSFEKPLPEELYAKISAGHLRDGTVIEGYWFLPQGSTCCGLWTTPADLARFAIEIQKSLRGESNRILSVDMTEQMLTPEAVGGFGLGMGLVGAVPDIYFSHSGGNVGFKCVVIAHESKGYGAAIMTNSDNGGALYQEILRGIADVYGWEGLLPKEYASVEELVDSYRARNRENPHDPAVSEASLNREGYEMLQAGEHRTAIAILSLNAELYPRSANCWDSLAEAYLTSGDEEKAIAHYTKALETLDTYPKENERFTTLRENITKHLELLQQQ
jgi:CubicO group peptidase (beta-lactamase class C family)